MKETTWWFNFFHWYHRLLKTNTTIALRRASLIMRASKCNARSQKSALLGHQAAHLRSAGEAHRGSASPDCPDDEVHQHGAAHHHQHGQGPLGHRLVAGVGAHSKAPTHWVFFPRLPSGVVCWKPRPGTTAIAALSAPRPCGFCRNAAGRLGRGGAWGQGWRGPLPAVRSGLGRLQQQSQRPSQSWQQ